MAKFVTGARADRVYKSLLAAGIVTEPEVEVARVVIDLRAGQAAMIYIQKFADDAIAEALVAGFTDLDAEVA